MLSKQLLAASAGKIRWYQLCYTGVLCKYKFKDIQIQLVGKIVSFTALGRNCILVNQVKRSQEGKEN